MNPSQSLKLMTFSATRQGAKKPCFEKANVGKKEKDCRIVRQNRKLFPNTTHLGSNYSKYNQT